MKTKRKSTPRWRDVVQHLLQYTNIEARLVKKLTRVIKRIFKCADVLDRETILSTLWMTHEALKHEMEEQDSNTEEDVEHDN